MAWRSVLCVAGILGVQSFLTLVMFESSSGGFFFLLTLFFDAALVVAAAWLTLQLQKIQDMGAALAAGDLDAKLDTEKLFFDVKRHGGESERHRRGHEQGGGAADEVRTAEN